MQPTNRSNVRILISIHALLAESDTRQSMLVRLLINISIHALLAESDTHAIGINVACSLIFLSTLSLRRATR